MKPNTAQLTLGSLTLAGATPSWHKYVRAPSSQIVLPKAILSWSGNVTNANALIHGHGVTHFSRPATTDAPPEVVLDFGQDVVGFPQINFAGASFNSPGIRLTFSETTEYLTNVSDFTRSDNGDTITPGTDQFVVPPHPTQWVDTHGCLRNGTKVCADGLHGFRYMRIALDALASDAPYTQPNGSVSISAVTLNFTALLGTPNTYTGSFECSDEALTQYWYDASYTNEMVIDTFLADYVDPRDSATPTLEGKRVIFDGAKRDRDPYVGDIAISGKTTYLSHVNAAIAPKNVLVDLAAHQRSDGWIPPASINNYTLPLFDYPLWWVVSSWDYILYTGDVAYSKQVWQTLLNVLNKYYPTSTASSGLLTKGSGATQGYGDYAFLPRTGEVTYYNALYVMALKNAASWATTLQEKDTASEWLSRATDISQAINAQLWDPSVSAYLDSKNTSTGVRHAQDGNSIAILSGTANASYANSALAYLSSHTSQPYGNAFYDAEVPGVDSAPQRVYAFISYFEIAARFATLSDASAVEEIRRLNGWMSSHDPEITMWEGIGPGGSPYEQGFTSMCHGWSTGVLPLMSNYVLGVTPTGPGFASWTLQPHLAGLSWAKGYVQTPHGSIEVSWKASGNGRFSIDVTVPRGTSAHVLLPAKLGQHVIGKGGSGQGVKNGYIDIGQVPAGRHSFQVR